MSLSPQGAALGRKTLTDLLSGRTNWEYKLPPTEISSPVVADGKILAEVDSQLYMWQADPRRCNLLGKTALGIEPCTSPALVDGILYVRVKGHVAAFDLRKSVP